MLNVHQSSVDFVIVEVLAAYYIRKYLKYVVMQQVLDYLVIF